MDKFRVVASVRGNVKNDRTFHLRWKVVREMGAKTMRIAMALLATVGLAVMLPGSVKAEEFKLPSAEEVATLPPEAIQFYAKGIEALDHINYEAAYENLTKAVALQPRAVRLNLIVAALALKHGRSKKADEARSYYETAIRCYENILAQPALEPSLRRDVENRLKIAKDEKETLAQRDAHREGISTQFIKALNREIAKATKTPKPASEGSRPQIPSSLPTGVLPPSAQPAVAAMPGVPPAYPGGQAPSAPSGPTTMPALPGAQMTPGAGAPGAMPGLPPMQQAPGAVPGQPAGQPPAGQPAPGGPPAGPGGEVMI